MSNRNNRSRCTNRANSSERSTGTTSASTNSHSSYRFHGQEKITEETFHSPNVHSISGSGNYNTARDLLVNHCVEKFDSGDYMRGVIQTLTKPTLEEPTGTLTEKESVENLLIKKAIDHHWKEKTTLEADLRRLYGVVWGRCTHELQVRIKSESSYTKMDTASDGIALLKVIKVLSELSSTDKDPFLTVLSATRALQCWLGEGLNDPPHVITRIELLNTVADK